MADSDITMWQEIKWM